MTRKEHLLTILAEECNEVAQRVSKALRFSLEEIQPDTNETMNNGERIIQEFNDLCAVMEILIDEKILVRPSATAGFQMAAKQIKVEKYLKYSQERGTLTPEVKSINGIRVDGIDGQLNFINGMVNVLQENEKVEVIIYPQDIEMIKSIELSLLKLK